MIIPSEGWARVLALAAHELRTPAGVVSGYCRMLLQGRAGTITAGQRPLLEAVDRSASRVSSVLAQMSELAHLEDGTTTLSRQAFEVSALVRPLVTEGSRPRVELATSLPAGRIEGDLVRLQHTFASVAALYPADPPTALAAAVRDGQVVVAIGARADVNAWSAANPAEPPAPFDDLRGGHGLTLVVARVVVRLHAGDIGTWRGAGSHQEVTIIRLPATAVV